MSSYRPKIKQSDGTIMDIPLDAETLNGKTAQEIMTSGIASSCYTIGEVEVDENIIIDITFNPLTKFALIYCSGLSDDFVSFSGYSIHVATMSGVKWQEYSGYPVIIYDKKDDSVIPLNPSSGKTLTSFLPQPTLYNNKLTFKWEGGPGESAFGTLKVIEFK